MNNNGFHEIFNKLKGCKNIAMTLHAMPDGDSLGSCTAMKYFLERDLKCNVELVSYDKLPENLIDFSFVNEVKFGKDISEVKTEDFDAILFLDCGSVSNISGKLKKEFNLPKNIFIINMDHHATNVFYGNMNYVDTKALSACSFLVNFFKEIKVKFDAELATRLLLGVCTDTMFFTIDNSIQALKDADFLISNGGDYAKVLDVLSVPLRMEKFYAILINNLKMHKDIKFGISFVNRKDIDELKLSDAETRLGINKLQYIRDFDFVCTLTELKDIIKGSFRSNRKIDVSLFAKELGGGGHKLAAAFTFPKISIEKAQEKVLEAINKVGIHKI
ncbi:MAG: DHH family phosphoesterase [Nanoarchaeota archaeon]